MKHESIFIRVDDLINRIDSDSDDFTIEEALSLNDGDEIQMNHWVGVSWPDHVVNPKFNGDADYGHPSTRDAIESGFDSPRFYGEC